MNLKFCFLTPEMEPVYKYFGDTTGMKLEDETEEENE